MAEGVGLGWVGLGVLFSSFFRPPLLSLLIPLSPSLPHKKSPPPPTQTATIFQQLFGLGIKVTENRPSHSLNSLIMLMNEPKPEGVCVIAAA